MGGLNVQQAAWLVTLLVSVIVVWVFWFVLKNSGDRDENYEEIKKKGYRIRDIYFVILFGMLLAATIFTVRELPYDQPVTFQDSTVVDVDVKAIQFGWEMSQEEFKVNQPYAFHVTSADVNHGFGIYNDQMMLLTQTQAMPDYTNTVYYKFEKPGTYQILCLEYCGVAHHLMVKEITVTN